MELRDRWDISYSVEEIKDDRISKRVLIKIKNHSPYKRTFKIYTDAINIKDQFANLRFRLYYNLMVPKYITIEKYGKEEVEVLIPHILNKGEDDHVVIAIENVDKNEVKKIKVYV